MVVNESIRPENYLISYTHYIYISHLLPDKYIHCKTVIYDNDTRKKREKKRVEKLDLCLEFSFYSVHLSDSCFNSIDIMPK